MQINIPKDWLMKNAHKEEGMEIGAGGSVLNYFDGQEGLAKKLTEAQSQLAALTAQNQRLRDRLTLAENERQDALKLLRDYEAEANVKMDAVVKENKGLREELAKFTSLERQPDRCIDQKLAEAAYREILKCRSPQTPVAKLLRTLARLKKGEK